ncbi:interleukin 17-7 [Elysia marginata]|uniref:Interleukin 17-7 n=1 Tax=Elysia marginata TaxID=1093978 RepID=A0AAV4G4A2_9GAST|nr:interleukin 17-7 [Elysia marginata]
MRSGSEKLVPVSPVFVLMSAFYLIANLIGGVMGTIQFTECGSQPLTPYLEALNITVSHDVDAVNIVGHVQDPNPRCAGTAYTAGYYRSSTCPWNVRSHVDNYRIPHTISYVQCRCKNCNHHYVHGGVCKEITREVAVLKKNCSPEGHFSMTRVFQRFPVACVCVPRLPL